MCHWLRERGPVYDDEDAKEIIDAYANHQWESNREKLNILKYQKFKELKAKGKVCINASLAWHTFMDRVKHGIYTMEHPRFRNICMFISVSALFIVFFSAFGSPIRLNNAENSPVIYKEKNFICRNGVRTLGNGCPIDTCYRPLDLEKYILDDKSRQVFYDKYMKLRKRNRSARPMRVFNARQSTQTYQCNLITKLKK